jgi:hypothetical protein
METKVCKKCGRELPLSQFEVEHTSKGDYYRGVCRECRAKYRKKWREENHSAYIAQALRRQKRQGDFLNSLKTSCIICGESEPCCIDFHHLDPSIKDFTIGQHRSRSKQWLIQEIKKCVCLCSNCHRKVHAGLIDLNDYITINHSSDPREEV